MNKPILILLIILLSASKNNAQNGALDLSFGDQGLVSNDYEPGFGDNFGHKLALQDDGKIVVACVLYDGTFARMGVYRYLTSGILDVTFGNGGLALASDLLGTSAGYDIAVQADGKIVVAGAAQTGDDDNGFAVARFLPNGQPDVSFGTQGLATHRLWGYNSFSFTYGLALQPDGKILLAGAKSDTLSYSSHAILLRCLPNGQLDPSFADNGVFDFQMGVTSVSFFLDVKLLANGNIIVAGDTYYAFTHRDILMIRLSANGVPDPTFGNNGVVITEFNDTSERIFSIAIQADHKIVLCGGSDKNASNGRVMVVRYTSAGLVDTTFAEGGVFYYSYQNLASVGISIVIQADGKLVLVGILNQDQMLLRLLPNGKLDPSFGEDGRVITTFPEGNNVTPYGIVIQPDHKIVVSGQQWREGNEGRTTLARYHSNFDPVVTQDSVAALLKLYPNPTFGQITLEFALSRTSDVKVAVYDMLGRWLGNLLDIQPREKGIYKEALSLDERLPAGVYQLHFNTEEQNVYFSVVKVTGK
jgi:uncharacterized delta-60 repeat protein